MNSEVLPSSRTGPDSDEDAPYTVAANYEFTLGDTGTRVAFIEWWPRHTCEESEPNIYYSLYSVAGQSKRIAFNTNRTVLVNEGQANPALQLPAAGAAAAERDR